MATTTRKRSQPRNADGEFASKTSGTTTKRRATGGNRGRKPAAKSRLPEIDFSSRNIALGTAAVAGAAIAGALFAAWRSNAFADLFERDLITGGAPKEARDVIDDDDREQFAPATVPLRDSKYDRELAAN